MFATLNGIVLKPQQTRPCRHICVCRLPVPLWPHFLCGWVQPCPFQTKSIISIWWCSQAGLSGRHCVKLMCLISGPPRTPITLWKLFEDTGAILTFHLCSVVFVLLSILFLPSRFPVQCPAAAVPVLSFLDVFSSWFHSHPEPLVTTIVLVWGLSFLWSIQSTNELCVEFSLAMVWVDSAVSTVWHLAALKHKFEYLFAIQTKGLLIAFPVAQIKSLFFSYTLFNGLNVT